jgi:membrane protein
LPLNAQWPRVAVAHQLENRVHANELQDEGPRAMPARLGGASARAGDDPSPRAKRAAAPVNGTHATAGWLRRVRDGVPGLRVFVKAVQGYIGHQSANQAGSVAFSSVLAMFPLLLCLSAAAAFIGDPGSAASMASRVIEYAPPLVADALRPAIDQVLRERNRVLLSIGVVVTLWAASSGTQAIRTALNRAYGVTHSLSFWQARLKVTVFTVIVTVGTVIGFSSVVILPYAWEALEQAGVEAQTPGLRDSVRYGLAFVFVTLLYVMLYGWLPDIRQRVRTVLPGALVGAALWLAVAVSLSQMWRTAGKLALLYGSLVGMVATLVFLYLSAVTLIFGAEINAVLRDRHGRDGRLRLGDAEEP